ncbi:class I SAM-dependent methyltransferase [Nocardia sp. NPDC056100]|uniref:class I SAM-dependent methyltransferase n=1 Tax=Nocardia sp. NPDC056100 TaxID=3345712 RepID=UPI0035DFEDE1
MRTDGDTWDIASGVGATALGMAAFRALISEGPDPGIRDDYARLFVEASDDPIFTGMLTRDTGRNSPFAGLLGARTRFFDDFFTEAAKSGVRQAVILAAGLDARAYRLDWLGGTTVFEIDQPQVLEFKDRVLAAHRAEPMCDRRSVGVDLRDDWHIALTAAGFDPALPTAWAAEGLVEYLPAATQDLLFHRIDELSAPGSYFAVNGFPVDADSSRLVGAESTFYDESGGDNPFGGLDMSELFYREVRTEPGQWLTNRGWSVRSTDSLELTIAYGGELPQLPDEVAEVLRKSFYLTASK